MHSFGLRNLLVTLLLILALVGCGGGGDGDNSSDQNDSGGSGGNAAPTIQGQPAGSVVASETYSFQPAASDPNGDQLTFSASNLPAWASFDDSTGRLSGTPSLTDIGTYNGITITVSDGQASTTLGPFAIMVAEVGIGTATLTWLPPTENADGTTLTDLAGYQIRYGRSREDMSSVIELTNPSLSVYMVEQLSSGTWYFAVAAVNTSGATSDLSNIASKTIS
jgi:hypothetical protein